MKKIALVIVLMMISATSASAGQNNGIGGLIIGAGGGALVGQAIGGNTESTVIGTAVGSMLGYLIGSESYHRPVQRYRHHPYPGPRSRIHREQHITQYNYYYEPTTSHQSYRPRCREAEILGTVNGKARKIRGTVCRTANGWELVDSGSPIHYHDDGPAHWEGDYYRDSRGQRWVQGRF